MLSEQADIWTGPNETSSLHKMVKYFFNFNFCLIFFSRYFLWHRACVFHFLWSKTPTFLHGSCLCSRSRAPQREREFPVLTYHQKPVLLSSTSHFPWPEQRQEGSWRNCSGPFPGREIHAMIKEEHLLYKFHSIPRTVCRSTGNNSAPTGRGEGAAKAPQTHPGPGNPSLHLPCHCS